MFLDLCNHNCDCSTDGDKMLVLSLKFNKVESNLFSILKIAFTSDLPIPTMGLSSSQSSVIEVLSFFCSGCQELPLLSSQLLSFLQNSLGTSFSNYCDNSTTNFTLLKVVTVLLSTSYFCYPSTM